MLTGDLVSAESIVVLSGPVCDKLINLRARSCHPQAGICIYI